jgi:hypothetical protein
MEPVFRYVALLACAARLGAHLYLRRTARKRNSGWEADLTLFVNLWLLIAMVSWLTALVVDVHFDL